MLTNTNISNGYVELTPAAPLAKDPLFDAEGNPGVTSTPELLNVKLLNLGTFTWGGETHALNLIARVNTQNGKTYYVLDGNGDGWHEGSDSVSHDWLDGLLNGGTDTVDTQLGGAVKGVNDARTTIINGHTLVLPTINELHALYNDPTVTNQMADYWYRTGFWSSTQHSIFGSSGTHYSHDLNASTRWISADDMANHVVFQVL